MAPPALLVLLILAAALAATGASAEIRPEASGPSARESRAAASERAARQGVAERTGGRGRRALLPALVDHDLSFEPGSQASSAIALEGDNPARGIAASNDAGAAATAFISDRGFASGSVVRRTLPVLARLPSSEGGGTAELDPCCDPAVAADLDGNLWMAVSSAAPGSRIVIGRVAAGATDFAAGPAVLPRSPAALQAARPALAVRSADRIAAAWVQDTGGTDAIVISQCAIAAGAAVCDGPDGWSAPHAVAVGGALSMPALALGPGGDLFAAWWDQGAGNAIRADRCPAGGNCSTAAGWEGPATIANLDAADDDGDGGLDPLPERCPIIAAPGGLVNPSPSIEVDAAGTVYVAYGDLRDNADPADPTRCTASGTDKTFDSFIAAGPGPGLLPAADGGRRLSADGPLELNDHFLPALSVDRSTGLVEASFYSTAGDPGGQRAARDYVASSNSGASYSAPVVISDGSSRFSGPLSDGIDFGERQGADSAGGVFRPVWTDNRALQSRDPDLYTLSPEVETAIVAGPSGEVPDAAATVAFETAAVRAECRLDGGQAAPCSSPLEVGPLPNGPHAFEIRATDGAGNPMDRTPAVASWTVADAMPPETEITRMPRHKTKRRRPRFEFVSNEPAARFQCRYDRGRWAGCRTPKRAKVKVGVHRFRVRARDLAGNLDPTPASFRFERKRECPPRPKRC